MDRFTCHDGVELHNFTINIIIIIYQFLYDRTEILDCNYPHRIEMIAVDVLFIAIEIGLDDATLCKTTYFTEQNCVVLVQFGDDNQHFQKKKKQ